MMQFAQRDTGGGGLLPHDAMGLHLFTDKNEMEIIYYLLSYLILSAIVYVDAVHNVL